MTSASQQSHYFHKEKVGNRQRRPCYWAPKENIRYLVPVLGPLGGPILMILATNEGPWAALVGLRKLAPPWTGAAKKESEYGAEFTPIPSPPPGLDITKKFGLNYDIAKIFQQSQVPWIYACGIINDIPYHPGQYQNITKFFGELSVSRVRTISLYSPN